MQAAAHGAQAAQARVVRWRVGLPRAEGGPGPRAARCVQCGGARCLMRGGPLGGSKMIQLRCMQCPGCVVSPHVEARAHHVRVGPSDPLGASCARNQCPAHPSKRSLSDGPTFQKCWSFGHQSSPLTPRALPLGRHTERTPTHTAVPPNPAVEPLPASLLNSFFCYELVISILST